MATRLISMGSKHGPAPEGKTVIDVTNFANPWVNTVLRPLDGTSAAVQDHIRYQTKDYWKKVDQLVAICNQLQGDAYLACRGGKHRSVYLTELVAHRLGISFSHRDLDKADR